MESATGFSGMSLFDAINHVMTTLSTGGFSTRDASSAFSPQAQWIAEWLYVSRWSALYSVRTKYSSPGRSDFSKDALGSGIFLADNQRQPADEYIFWNAKVFDFEDALRITTFNVISVLDNGFGLTDFGAWSFMWTTILFIFPMLAGCPLRFNCWWYELFHPDCWHYFKKQARQLMHPSGVFPQNTMGDQLTMRSFPVLSWLFVLSYMTVIILQFQYCWDVKHDTTEVISGSVTAVGNVGPRAGSKIGPLGNFTGIPDAAKWVPSIDMMLGRLRF